MASLDLITQNRVEAWRNSVTMALDLLFGRYPSFIYRRSSRADEMPPIFCFHSTETNYFEKLLKFLKRNGYITIDCDEYYEMQATGNRNECHKKIMISFDDGLREVYTVVYPLLKKYNMKAVVFLIPGRIRETVNDLYFNLGDDRGRKDYAEKIKKHDDKLQPLATWNEIEVMHKSGLIDFQSHTLLHNRIFSDDKVIDFVNPNLLNKIHPHRLTMWEEKPNSEISYTLPLLGAPIYKSSPRMAGQLAVKEEKLGLSACVNYVKQKGGNRYFDSNTWKNELFDVYNRNSLQEKQIETLDEQENNITNDLLNARKIIENYLPGKKVRHLAYPWGVGSEIAERSAKKVGYISCYWGRVDDRLKNKFYGNPFRMARIGSDFVKLLEGRGRSRLIDVIGGKLLRNLER